MESVPVRRRSCLLRLREHCPFRKLCTRTYDVSAAASSPTGPSWSDVSMPTAKQPINTVCSEPLPPLGRCQSISSSDQSEADAHMEEDPAAENQQNQQNHQNQQQDPEDRMELNDDVDPETGERAQG